MSKPLHYGIIIPLSVGFDNYNLEMYPFPFLWCKKSTVDCSRDNASSASGGMFRKRSAAASQRRRDISENWDLPICFGDVSRSGATYFARVGKVGKWPRPPSLAPSEQFTLPPPGPCPSRLRLHIVSPRSARPLVPDPVYGRVVSFGS